MSSKYKRIRSASPNVILTPREKAVVAALARGSEVRVVAHRFGLSPNTVWAQLRTAMRKLNTHNRAELSLIAIQRGYIPCPCKKHASESAEVAHE
jgi:DNA-binding NarL/FixJ family response regulator